MKKVMDPDPAGQKSTDPTGSGFSSLALFRLFLSTNIESEKNVDVNLSDRIKKEV